MKITRANIAFHEFRKLKHQHNLLLKDPKAVPTSPPPSTVIWQDAGEMGRLPNTSLDIIGPNDISIIGGIYKSHTHPFLLNF